MIHENVYVLDIYFDTLSFELLRRLIMTGFIIDKAKLKITERQLKQLPNISLQLYSVKRDMHAPPM